mgnify:CR=1 FL=1
MGFLDQLRLISWQQPNLLEYKTNFDAESVHRFQILGDINRLKQISI